MRWLFGLGCVLGWAVLIAAVVVPLSAIAWAATDANRINTQVVGTPGVLQLTHHSLTLCGVASLGALLLGLAPAAVFGSCSQRARPWLAGLLLAPLIVPPQVYAYAWGLLGSGGDERWAGGAVRAGLISAGWLWPVVSLAIAAGWRSSGRVAYSLALLDASPAVAFLRAVLPAIRPTVVAAVCLVSGITLIEYAIPHLTLCRVWATELMVLVDVHAPPGQVVRMACQPVAVAAILAAAAAWAARSSGGWQPISEEDATPDGVGRLNSGPAAGAGKATWLAAGLVWAGSLGLPVGLMLANLRVPSAWGQGLRMFSPQWADSLQVSVTTGFLCAVVAMATMGLWQASGWWPLRWGGWFCGLTAVVPAPLLGVGFVLAFNRAGAIGDLYTETPAVWILALVARYSVVAVLLAWLAVGQRTIVGAEQARVDGGKGLDILTHVTLPVMWPALAAGGLIVALLALFEVVVTQMVVPPAFGSIAMTILNYMHYGRDDAVITSSITLMGAGVVLTQICAHLLSRAGSR